MNTDKTNPPTMPAAPSGMDALLNKAEAANLLGVSVRTLDGLMARRMVPFVKLGSKIVRFDRADVLAHLKARYQITAHGGSR